MCGSLSIGDTMCGERANPTAASAWRDFCWLWLAWGWHSREGERKKKGKRDANHLSWGEQGLRKTETDREMYTERCLCFCQCHFFGVSLKFGNRIRISACSVPACLYIWGTTITSATTCLISQLMKRKTWLSRNTAVKPETWYILQHWLSSSLTSVEQGVTFVPMCIWTVFVQFWQNLRGMMQECAPVRTASVRCGNILHSRWCISTLHYA